MEKEKNNKHEAVKVYQIIKDFITAIFFVYTKDYTQYIRNRYTNGYYVL